MQVINKNHFTIINILDNQFRIQATGVKDYAVAVNNTNSTDKNLSTDKSNFVINHRHGVTKSATVSTDGGLRADDAWGDHSLTSHSAVPCPLLLLNTATT